MSTNPHPRFLLGAIGLLVLGPIQSALADLPVPHAATATPGLPSTQGVLEPRDTARSQGTHRGSPLSLVSSPVEAPMSPFSASLEVDPFYQFVTNGTLETNNPAQFLHRLDRYLFSLGFALPNPDAPDAINESATLSWTYPLGDVDGDGYDEVALDVYCVDRDICYPLSTLLDNPLDYLLDDSRCGLFYFHLPHWIEVQSLRSGDRLWDRPLETPYDQVPDPTSTNPAGRLGWCTREYVVGVLPNPDGTQDLLLYRIEALLNTLHHEVYRLAGKDGHVVWKHEREGFWALAPLPGVITPITHERLAGGGVVYAHNALTLPHLQAPPTQGVRLAPVGTKTNLLLRGVSYEAAIYWVKDVGYVLSSYQPLEWAARLDPATGKVLWEKETFQPNGTRNVFPVTYPASYWNMGCCWDLTGDSEPDLIYTTYEWAPVPPLGGLVGPKGLDSQTVLFDAQDGRLVWSVYVVTGAGLFKTFLVPLGSVTGGHHSDFIQYIGKPPASNHLQVRGGADGSILWELKASHALEALVVGGDAVDGSNDLLLAHLNLVSRELANVTPQRLTLHEGATGHVRWETTTLAAPLDVLLLNFNLRRNGVPDLDADGVGDVVTDKPTQLPDLTTVHRVTFRSGLEGHPLVDVGSVGAFAFPVAAGDLDGDGGHDFTITQGDLVDLWITAYRGRDASPLWSRRILTIPLSEAALSLPLLRHHNVEADGDPSHPDLLIGHAMYVQTMGGGHTIRGWYQQHVATAGADGAASWARPAIEEGDVSVRLGEPTPATIQYLGWQPPHEAPPSPVLSVPLLMGLSGLGSLGLSIAVTLYVQRRKT